MKAFPTPSISVNDEARITSIGGEGGMDLRDYFAAKAMQGWLTTYADNIDCHMVSKTTIAKFSYEVADAMLKARQA